MGGPIDPRLAIVDQALDRARAEVGEVVVVRDGLSLLVRRSDVVVRVRPRSFAPVAEREVAVATVLAEVGVPITPIVRTDRRIDSPGGAPSDPQPWMIDGSVVTAWRWVDAVGTAGPTELGVLARALRNLTSDGPAFAVPRFDPIAAIRGAVAHLPVEDPQANTVLRLARSLGPAWAAVADTDPAGTAVVHGDLHRDNVVAAARGPLLTDLELAGAGPPSYDAAPAVVAVDRYGADPSTLDAFLDALGDDPREWDGFATCVAVYELWVTAWAVGVRDRSPQLAIEAERRLASLTEGADHRWHLQ